MRIRGFSSSYEYEETNFRSHIREKASMSTIQLVQQPSPTPLPNKRKSKGCGERNSEIGSMPISINYIHTHIKFKFERPLKHDKHKDQRATKILTDNME